MAERPLVEIPLTLAEQQAMANLPDNMLALARLAERLLPQAVRDIAALRLRQEQERRAWARLVKAAVVDEAQMAVGTNDEQIEGARAEHDAAKQALRDLGVDVDALLA